MSVTEDLRRIYDRYFASADYDARYPHPNQGTLRCLWAHGIGKAEHVLDIGSGNGRYAVPVLLHSRTELTACDISPVALKGLRLRLSDQPDCLRRLHTLEGDALSLPPGARFDFMLMLFGVLGHIATQTERLATLRQLRLWRDPAASWCSVSPASGDDDPSRPCNPGGVIVGAQKTGTTFIFSGASTKRQPGFFTICTV